jgi:hypothetical protein
VRVEIDEARGYDAARRIDRRPTGQAIARDRGNASGRDADVPCGVEAGLGINYASTRNDEIECLLSGRWCTSDEDGYGEDNQGAWDHRVSL